MMTVGLEGNADLRAKCICARCPSYDDCARKGKELLYCMERKSKCKLQKFGCVCGSCPVEKMAGFTGVYFCISGKSPDIGGAKSK